MYLHTRTQCKHARTRGHFHACTANWPPGAGSQTLMCATTLLSVATQRDHDVSGACLSHVFFFLQHHRGDRYHPQAIPCPLRLGRQGLASTSRSLPGVKGLSSMACHPKLGRQGLDPQSIFVFCEHLGLLDDTGRFAKKFQDIVRPTRADTADTADVADASCSHWPPGAG